MHTIDRTVGSHRSRDTPKGCRGRPQTDFLSFHGSIVLCDTQFVDTRVTAHFLIHIDADTYQISKEHDSEYAVPQFLPASIKAQRKHHCHRNNQDRPAFCHIGKISRVFQRMRRVDTEITATVCTQLLDRNNCGRRALGNHLFLSLECSHFHLSVKSHRRSLDNQYKAYNQGKRQ